MASDGLFVLIDVSGQDGHPVGITAYLRPAMEKENIVLITNLVANWGGSKCGGGQTRKLFDDQHLGLQCRRSL